MQDEDAEDEEIARLLGYRPGDFMDVDNSSYDEPNDEEDGDEGEEDNTEAPRRQPDPHAKKRKKLAHQPASQIAFSRGPKAGGQVQQHSQRPRHARKAGPPAKYRW